MKTLVLSNYEGKAAYIITKHVNGKEYVSHAQMDAAKRRAGLIGGDYFNLPNGVSYID